VEEGAGSDDELGVAGAHAVVGDHRARDAGAVEQPEEAQGDVEDDLDVDPGVVGHPEPLRCDLRHVPPGAHLIVRVDGLEEALELAVAASRRADVRVGDRLARGLTALVGPGVLCVGDGNNYRRILRFASGPASSHLHEIRTVRGRS